MSIRLAEKKDIPAILEMCDRFFKTTSYPNFHYDKVYDTIERLVSGQPNHDHLALVYGDWADGMILAVASELPFSKLRVATELAWWVNPEARKTGAGQELLEAYEYWAYRTNCKYCHMAHLNDENSERLDKLFKSRDYKTYEVAYLKEVN